MLARGPGRRAGLLLVLAALGCGGPASTAGASNATRAYIVLDQAEGTPGSVVTGRGAGFDHWSSEPIRDRPTGEDQELVWTIAGAVRIHWNALEGSVVWEGSPGIDGAIEFAFDVPHGAAPGSYTVVATQTGYDGKPTGGTPARATFRVLAPRSAGDPGAPAGAAPATAAPGPSATRTRGADRPARRGDARRRGRAGARSDVARTPTRRRPAAGGSSASPAPAAGVPVTAVRTRRTGKPPGDGRRAARRGQAARATTTARASSTSRAAAPAGRAGPAAAEAPLPATRGGTSPVLAAALGALAGAAAVALLALRRRRPGAPEAPPAAGRPPGAPPDAVAEPPGGAEPEAGTTDLPLAPLPPLAPAAPPASQPTAEAVPDAIDAELEELLAHERLDRRREPVARG